MVIWDTMDNGNGRCHPYRGGVFLIMVICFMICDVLACMGCGIHGLRYDDLMPCISKEESYSGSDLGFGREYIVPSLLLAWPSRV